MDRRALLRGMAAAGSVGLLGSMAGCTYSEVESAGEVIETTGDAAATTGETATAGATVEVASTDEFGEILVDAAGMTLYLFTEDEGGESACYGDCEANWPPLTADGEPTGGDGVAAALGTVERTDGSAQVTAAGHPLYYFAGDEEPGDANGQGLGDAWYVVSPAGERVGGDEGSHGHDEVPDGPADGADVAMGNPDGGHHFGPHVVWVRRGGTVTWTLENGAHSTTAYHPENDRSARVPEGAAAWDSGVLTGRGATFEHTFETEGVYDYFCIPHESTGMVGSVIVGEPDPDDEPALAPPSADLPEAAREKIEALNGSVREALGGGAAGTTTGTGSGSGTSDPYY